MAGFLKGKVIHMGTFGEHTSLIPLEPTHSWPPDLPREAHAIRQILVCLDASPFSEACLPHAVAIAKSLGSAITLLHVMEPPAREHVGFRSTDVLDWEITRQEACAFLARLERMASEALGRRVATRLEQGHPADRIASVARELDADLTILGSQGARDLSAWNLGSTVMQALELTRGSVLLARRQPPTTVSGSLRHILVPLDGSLRSESVLPTVARIARAHESEVLLAFAVPEPVPTAVLRTSEDLSVARELATRLEASGARYLDTLREQLVREGIPTRTRIVRCTDERHCINELSQRERSDLIVLSAHGSTCNPALTFGSFTSHLLTHSVVPLLVLQDLRHSELLARDDVTRAPPLRPRCPERS
jgi:nucleotide-binding universal stress UspA family protein